MLSRARPAFPRHPRLLLPPRYSTLGACLGATALDISGLNLDGTASKLVADLKLIKGEVTKAELELEVGWVGCCGLIRLCRIWCSAWGAD